MKTGLFLAALVPLAAAQPHNNEKRQAVVTEVDVVTKVAPDVMVYVDGNGVPVSTSTMYEGGNKASPKTHVAAAPSPPAAAPAAPVAPVAAPVNHHRHGHKHHGHKHHKAADANAAAAAAPAPAPAPAVEHKHKHKKVHHASSSSGGTAASSALGITYSPYNADGTCKSQGQVNSDLDKLAGYGLVRIYGTDCDQVNTVGSAAQARGMKIMAGIFDLSDIAGDVQLLISGLKSNWAGVDTISVGNELVNSGLNSPAEVIAAMAIARPLLRAAGFSGNIVTVDTFTALIANPELCHASDFAAANAHAFFDSTCEASNAGNWAVNTVAQVQKACGKTVVVTESGWPHEGYANGAAIPGPAEQQAAVSSLKSHFSDGGLIIFTAFDDLWKSDNPGSFGAEKFWGINAGQ